MKKGKWLISVMLAAVCCFVAFSFTACDDGDGDKGPRSEKVADEAAWRAAFDTSGMTNYEWNSTYIEKTAGSSTGLYEKNSMEVRDGYSFKTVYYDIEDGEREDYIRYQYYALDEKWDASRPDSTANNGTVYCYELDEEDSQWYYYKSELHPGPLSELDEGLWVVFNDILSEYDEEQEELIDRYDEFSYDEARGLYVLTIDELIEEHPDHTTSTTKDVEVTVFIRNGKIEKGTMKALSKGTGNEPDINVSFICSLGKIGECSVTLPNAQPGR